MKCEILPDKLANNLSNYNPIFNQNCKLMSNKSTYTFKHVCNYLFCDWKQESFVVYHLSLNLSGSIFYANYPLTLPSIPILSPSHCCTQNFPISTYCVFHPYSSRFKLCTDLRTNSRKVLNASMAGPTQPPAPEVNPTPKPKQIISEKTLYYKKCPNGYLYTFCPNEWLPGSRDKGLWIHIKE